MAHNQLIGELRQTSRRTRLADQHGVDIVEAQDDPAGIHLLADVPDDLLRMLFACCDDSIPLESQLVFALKTVCGFDVREIAQRLVQRPDAAQLRQALSRKASLRG